MATYRTHTCHQLNATLAETTVTLSGWIHRLRNHGGVGFLDLRDRTGLCQVVLDPKLMQKTEHLRSEFVVRLKGIVKKRPDGMINKKLVSGEIEILATELEILSAAEVLPFSLEDEGVGVNENTRLKYRYLDLRRPQLQKNFLMRHKILQKTRQFFDSHSFVEIETPILYKSTPEGARDYLVPSRVHPGEFYALPQSPQTLKQLLMIAGFERYCQIARCFRDEDLRSDRQPEFTQVDVEVSFMEQKEFQDLLEEYIVGLWQECLGAKISRPFQRITYDEAMNSYGSDKPDLRFSLKLENVTSIAQKTDFKVFSGAASAGGSVIALAIRSEELNAKGIAHPQWSRKFYDSLNAIVSPQGLKGLVWAKVEEPGTTWSSSAAKFFKPEDLKNFEAKLNLKKGDYVFFAAEKAPRVLEAMGTLRLFLAKELGFIKDGIPEDWKFVWVTDFPLFVYDEIEGRLYAAHHPFTRPLASEESTLLNSTNLNELSKIRAEAYDLALNGFEVGGGSLRIFKPEVQAAMFRALGLSQEEAKEKFGFFLEALSYGTPPHGGIAFGVDRLAMLMAGADSLRDVIAFPKTARAQDLMSSSPSRVSPDQLAELRLQILKPSS